MVCLLLLGHIAVAVAPSLATSSFKTASLVAETREMISTAFDAYWAYAWPMDGAGGEGGREGGWSRQCMPGNACYSGVGFKGGGGLAFPH